MKFRTVRVVDAVSLNREVGENIRKARDSAKLSQQELGAHLGMTRASVSNIERGSHAIMLSHVYNVALYLDIPISRLLPKVSQ